MDDAFFGNLFNNTARQDRLLFGMRAGIFILMKTMKKTSCVSNHICIFIYTLHKH